MNLEMKEIALPAPAQVQIAFRLTAQVNVTDAIAQRRVSKLLLDEVGNLLYGERPSLVAGRRLLWRVPVWLGSPTRGPMGQVGALDVDAQTGEILFTQAMLDDIAERGGSLFDAPRLTPDVLRFTHHGGHHARQSSHLRQSHTAGSQPGLGRALGRGRAVLPTRTGRVSQ